VTEPTHVDLLSGFCHGIRVVADLLLRDFEATART
jgi:hypothetical protein